MNPGTSLLASPPPSWAPLVKAVAADLIEADAMLAKSESKYGKSTPENHHVFRALYACPLDAVRVVWVTSEPCGRGQGLGPSTAPPFPLSPTLKAIMDDARQRAPHGDLTEWAHQGVLFLTLALTAPVQRTARTPSHAAFWAGVVKRMCEHIQQHRPDTVFVAFGTASTVRQYLSGRAVVLEVIGNDCLQRR